MKLAGVLMALGLAAAPLGAQPPSRARAEDVKAAFVYNFARFVEWPPAAAARQPGTVVLAVLGGGPLATAVHQLDGKMLGERRLKVLPVASPAQAREAHMLLVTAGAGVPVADVARAVEGHGVLVVGDEQGFAEQGGMINFVVRDSKVRFEVNVHEAQSEQLRLSSQLLKLATLVGPGTR